MADDRERRLRAAADARLRRGLEGEQPPEPERPRRKIPFQNFESWIDRQIREAQERGLFDNLRGHGQPMAPADPNEVHAGEDAMGLKILKNQDALPAWIELNKEIGAAREQCRRILHYYTRERDRDRRALRRRLPPPGRRPQPEDRDLQPGHPRPPPGADQGPPRSRTPRGRPASLGAPR